MKILTIGEVFLFLNVFLPNKNVIHFKSEGMFLCASLKTVQVKKRKAVKRNDKCQH